MPRSGPLLGAHQSIAGGLHRALERGRALGCQAVQIFTRSARQWALRPLAEDEVRAFAAARAATGIRALLAHDSYLPNSAAPVESLRERSVRELIAELERCERLGIPYLVAHPGAHCGAGEDAGLRTAARSLGEVLEACRGCTATIALENTAGQGTQLGGRLDRHEHIGRGALGLGAFRRLLRDRRFRGLPMCIETPKGADLAEDRLNLAVLRRLA